VVDIVDAAKEEEAIEVVDLISMVTPSLNASYVIVLGTLCGSAITASIRIISELKRWLLLILLLPQLPSINHNSNR
ncbi:hypothetical protein PIB30_115622, partial [Stylosanthes scabra]|nr:hypothetical protein [Stylosanthes scabra]